MSAYVLCIQVINAEKGQGFWTLDTEENFAIISGELMLNSG
jgi:hypothetical protein